MRLCQVCRSRTQFWGWQGPSRCGKEKSLLGSNICRSMSLHSESVQQCLLVHQEERSTAIGRPSPYLALQELLPQLLVLDLEFLEVLGELGSLELGSLELGSLCA